MRQYKSYTQCLSFVFALCCLIVTGCQEDLGSFRNKVFISNATVETLLLKKSDTATGVVQTSIAQLEKTNIEVLYKADLSLVDRYNSAFNDKAIALPEICYELKQSNSTIAVGAVKGNDVIVQFKELSSLNRDSVYVLPITIGEANLEVLSSAKTRYFVFKGAALVNVVADVKNNKLKLSQPEKGKVLNNLTQITAEALIRVNKFGKSISTIMGVEEKFLIRIGDAGLPNNQLQIVISGDKITDPTWTVKTNEWTHLAVTFDSATKKVELYINGVKRGGEKISQKNSNVNWGGKDFWIGYSYAEDRFLDGDICECRVWNRIVKREEILSKNHFYTVAPTAEGLVAYWKFDEGTGTLVKDHTSNGNDMVSANPLNWRGIELPAK